MNKWQFLSEPMQPIHVSSGAIGGAILGGVLGTVINPGLGTFVGIVLGAIAGNIIEESQHGRRPPVR